MIKSVFATYAVARSIARFAAVALLCVAATTASAAPVSISGLNWTGTGGGSTDPHWKVVAKPSTFPGNYDVSPYVGPPSAPIMPSAAYIPSGGSPPPPPPPVAFSNNVPGVWYGGNSNQGLYDSRWIGLQENDVSSLWPGFVAPANYEDYATVYRTSFTAAGTGQAFISLLAAADNAVTFFVTSTDPGIGADPNIVYSNVWRPTVSGQQVAPQQFGLGTLHWVEGTVNVDAGTNYLYAVVQDTLKIDGPDGNYGFTGLIVVPEPSSFVLAGCGAIGLALVSLRRRAKPQA
jgi:hypothetical protein